MLTCGKGPYILREKTVVYLFLHLQSISHAVVFFFELNALHLEREIMLYIEPGGFDSAGGLMFGI
jgi:hypothetical protein